MPSRVHLPSARSGSRRERNCERKGGGSMGRIEQAKKRIEQAAEANSKLPPTPTCEKKKQHKLSPTLPRPLARKALGQKRLRVVHRDRDGADDETESANYLKKKS